MWREWERESFATVLDSVPFTDSLSLDQWDDLFVTVTANEDGVICSDCNVRTPNPRHYVGRGFLCYTCRTLPPLTALGN